MFAASINTARADEAYLDWYPNAQIKTLHHAGQFEQVPESSLCGGAYWEPPQKDLSLTSPLAGSILGSAKSYEYSQDRALLKQDVILQQNNLQIESDQVALDFTQQQAEISGQIRFRSPGFLLTSEQATLDLNTQQTNFFNAAYLVHSAQIRGQAQQVSLSQAGILTIHNGTYTGCPPDREDWHFSGKKIRIDRDAGWGTATNMSLYLGRIPVFYIPYFVFPTDDQRHTGLLYPTIYNLSAGDISIPFYWNIAPHYDATITPRNVTDRGILWQTEFRFLNPTTGQGRIVTSLLANDKDYAQKNRNSFLWQQQAYWQDRLAFNLDYNFVSDSDYLDDFGHSLNTASISQLNQSAQLSYEGNTWQWQAQLQAYQTVDDTIAPSDHPYRQLPKLSAHNTYALAQGENSQLDWNNYLEYVYFEQPLSDTVPYAQRAHWESNINYAWENSWFFFKPQLGLLTTAYDFNQTTTSDNTRINRTLPRFNLDTGLYFQRPLTLGNQNYWQTLEPRLFYLYVPYRDQSSIPLLDTSALNFDVEQLYRLNRFSGIDRINDSQRLSLSFGSRLYNASGQQIIATQIGQIFYEKGLRVQLIGDNSTPTKESSHLLSDTQIQWNNDTRSNIDFEWNQNSHEVESLRTDIQWHPNAAELINASYRYRQASNGLEAIQQMQWSFTRPLNDRWRAIGAWTYDINQHNSLEYLGGLAYETCCWRTAWVFRQRLSEDDTTNALIPRYSTLLTLELKGLGKLGDDLEKMLSESIPGLQ